MWARMPSGQRRMARLAHAEMKVTVIHITTFYNLSEQKSISEWITYGIELDWLKQQNTLGFTPHSKEQKF